MSKITFRPGAEADLIAIAAFVAQFNVEAALRLVRRLRDRCQILETHFEAGRPRPELGEALRSLAEPPYVIVYRVTGNVAEIVAVLHGARDLPAALAARLTEES